MRRIAKINKERDDAQAQLDAAPREEAIAAAYREEKQVSGYGGRTIRLSRIAS